MRVYGLECGTGTVVMCKLRVQGSGFRVQGLGFRVQGSGFMVQGSGECGTLEAVSVWVWGSAVPL